jgi:hypothetical protein
VRKECRTDGSSFSLGAVFALGVLAVSPLALAHHGDAMAAEKSSKSTTAAKSKNLHQFTGIVTALDKNTLTVEKQGKKPQSRVFTRHAELKTTGELEQDAHVTVYYRDEDGLRGGAPRGGEAGKRKLPERPLIIAGPGGPPRPGHGAGRLP